jgi:hypothetical protein
MNISRILNNTQEKTYLATPARSWTSTTKLMIKDTCLEPASAQTMSGQSLSFRDLQQSDGSEVDGGVGRCWALLGDRGGIAGEKKARTGTRFLLTPQSRATRLPHGANALATRPDTYNGRKSILDEYE